MRQTWLACALTTLLLGGCNDNNSDTATPTPTPTPDPVLTASLAMGKTAGGKNEDIALWLAKSDSEASRLYTVDKKSGLEVYSLQSGALLHTQDDDLDNEGSTGVDVRYNSFGHDVLAVEMEGAAVAQVDGRWTVTRAVMSRSARILMEGAVRVPADTLLT